MYPKLSGMTGTASTEAAEFYDIYKMNVVTIPTNLPVQRIDEEDEFYKNTHDKFRAIAKSIKEHADKGQPVLVGTVSIEKSELLSEFLHQEKRSEEHTSELQSLMRISYAVFCLKKKNKTKTIDNRTNNKHTKKNKRQEYNQKRERCTKIKVSITQ